MALIRPLATRSADSGFGSVHRLGFASYVADLREAMEPAEHSVSVVTPFIDDAGIEFLNEAWKDRCMETSTWEIYVRDCPPKLRSTARRNGWEVYNYPSGERYGMHAKLVSIDDRRVILGSMNLIKKNMYSNLELGVDISDDPIVNKLARLEYKLQRASKLVSP